jgi:hypothetical protein
VANFTDEPSCSAAKKKGKRGRELAARAQPLAGSCVSKSMHAVLEGGGRR